MLGVACPGNCMDFIADYWNYCSWSHLGNHSEQLDILLVYFNVIIVNVHVP